MSLEFVSAAISFRGLVRQIDVGLLTGGDCALVAEELARVEKTCAAARAVAAARAGEPAEEAYDVSYG